LPEERFAMKTLVFGSGWLRFVSWLGFLLLLPLMVGCGPGEGKVTGQVLFNGKPLPGGQVMFKPVQEGINSALVTLDEQGNYSVVLPAVEYQISVDNRDLAPRPEIGGVPPGLPPAAKAKIAEALKHEQRAKGESSATGTHGHKIPGKYVEIPRRYYYAEGSGLKYTVQRGNQTHNIELTGK
jgi:hypothetical protein